MSKISTPLGIIIIIVIVFLLGGGILAYQYWWLPKQETPPVTQETPPVTVDETAGWQTYQNNSEKYAVKYPPNWYLDVSNSMFVTISNYDPSVYRAGGSPSTENIRIVISTYANVLKNETVESWVSRIGLLDKQNILIDSIKAIRGKAYLGFGGDFGGDVRIIYDGKGYQIAYSPYDSKLVNVFNNILSTFKFIPLSETANITVLSPNGGEKLEIGKTYQIRYQINNPPTANVQNWKVSSFVNCSDWNVGDFTVIDSHYLSTDKGFVSWTIPAKPNGPANQCKVKIEMVDTVNAGTPQAAVYRDESDATFSIIQ